MLSMADPLCEGNIWGRLARVNMIEADLVYENLGVTGRDLFEG